MTDIRSAHAWPDNAHMMADVFQLHVKPNAVVVDPTYGEGNFYTVSRPAGLIGHDKYKGPCFDGVDWGDLPEEDESVDVVVFDAPYVARGGRATSTITDMVDAFGMAYADATPEALWANMTRGLDEAVRVLKPGGLVMTKAMWYVSSGQMQNALQWYWNHIESIGLKAYDWFIFVGEPGPQPQFDKCKTCNGKAVDPNRIGIVQTFVMDDLDGTGHYDDEVCPKCQGAGGKPRRQVHARSNASHLLIAQKPKRRGKK